MVATCEPALDLPSNEAVALCCRHGAVLRIRRAGAHLDLMGMSRELLCCLLLAMVCFCKSCHAPIAPACTHEPRRKLCPSPAPFL